MAGDLSHSKYELPWSLSYVYTSQQMFIDVFMCTRWFKWLYLPLGNARSLKHLCRLRIREHLSHLRLRAPVFISFLPLPPRLKDYLRYKEFDVYSRGSMVNLQWKHIYSCHRYCCDTETKAASMHCLVVFVMCVLESTRSSPSLQVFMSPHSIILQNSRHSLSSLF